METTYHTPTRTQACCHDDAWRGNSRALRCTRTRKERPALRGLLLGVGILACASEPLDVDCQGIDGGVTLEVWGTGPEGGPFRPLTDGDVLPLVAGPQGGQHVWVQLRARNLCPNGPAVRIQVLVEGDLLVGEAVSGRRWRGIMGEPGLYATWDYPVVIDDGQYCALVNGAPARLHVRVDDRAGRVIERSVAILVRGWASGTDPGLRAAREACCANTSNRRCYPNGPPTGDAGSRD